MNTPTQCGELKFPYPAALLSAIVVLLLMALPVRALAQCGTPGNAACPSTLLTTYYDTGAPVAQNGIGGGDNTVELIAPAGCANTSLAPCSSQNLCAMIYVLDSNENLGECCACQITPQGLLTLSVKTNLTSSWGLKGGAPEDGVIEVVSTLPNEFVSPRAAKICNPALPYSLSRELNGYILHNLILTAVSVPKNGGIAEAPFADAGDPAPSLQNSLITRCANLLGQPSGSGSGACSCGTNGN